MRVLIALFAIGLSLYLFYKINRRPGSEYFSIIGFSIFFSEIDFSVYGLELKILFLVASLFLILKYYKLKHINLNNVSSQVCNLYSVPGLSFIILMLYIIGSIFFGAVFNFRGFISFVWLPIFAGLLFCLCQR